MAKIAVLGCGPSGLLAALAYTQAGHHVSIFSNEIKKSPIGGAQYIDRSIPGLLSMKPDGEVSFLKRGSRQGYARKVYGSPSAPCSWSRYQEGTYPAWAMETAYDRLWDLFNPRMARSIMTHKVLNTMLDADIYQRVVSTIPRPALCSGDHRFESQTVWISPTLPFQLPDNNIYYSGLEQDEWYRVSNLFGRTGSEFATKPNTRVWKFLFEVNKPLEHSCTCFDGRVMFLGRFGLWQKEELVSDAYFKAAEDANALH